MSEEEVAIVILGIIFGSAISIVFIVQLFGLIKSFLNRKNSDEAPVEINEQLIEDYLSFKKHAEQRIRRLEQKQGISSPTNSRAELNSPSEENSLQDDRKYSSSGDNKLKNMLRK